MYNNHTEPPALSIIRTKWKQYFLHFIDHWRVWISTGPFQLFESTQIFGIKFFITPRINSWLLLYTVHNAQQPDSKGDSVYTNTKNGTRHAKKQYDTVLYLLMLTHQWLKLI